jgi:hypothetical protein
MARRLAAAATVAGPARVGLGLGLGLGVGLGLAQVGSSRRGGGGNRRLLLLPPAVMCDGGAAAMGEVGAALGREEVHAMVRRLQARCVERMESLTTSDGVSGPVQACFPSRRVGRGGGSHHLATLVRVAGALAGTVRAGGVAA